MADAVERRLTLTPVQMAGLKELAGEKGFATLSPAQAVFQIFQTTLMAWMHRTSGEDHLALGVATHGRTTPMMRQMAGCFVDIFPVQARVSADDTFRRLHAKMRSANMANLRHATPGSFEARGVARFSAVINAFPVEFGTFEGHPVAATWLGNGCTDPTHALRLNLMDEGASGLPLKFLFNAEVVPEAQADLAVAHLMALFEALIADPDAQVASVPLAQPDDASAALSAHLRAQPAVSDVLEAVAQQAEAAPDALAITDDNGTWTRATLARRTDAVAAMLRDSGITPGSRVGIYLTRTGHLVAALLGVLKVGASFVPLDPGQPAGRLDAIAAEAQLALILTEPDIARDWPDATPSADVTTLPAAAEPLQPHPAPRAAYVLFTSGSTGRPKGRAGRARGPVALRALGAEHLCRGGPRRLGAAFGHRV